MNQEIDQKLTLKIVLDWIVEDKLITNKQEVEITQYAISWVNRDKDITEIICDYQAENTISLGKKITQEKLNEWLAARVGLPLFYIDPLKIVMV